MRFYFAPLEGITGYIYRNAHYRYFHHIDRYFSPFIVANQYDRFKSREIKDILPENNQELPLVPQILTNNSKDFLHTANKLMEFGYNEINLNLGCPSGTVVSKNRGSGFLAKKEQLDAFLEEIYDAFPAKISIKTRIGKDDPKEFYDLIEIFNKYPIHELIIHPRIQKDYYNNKPNWDVFRDAIKLSKIPICYNGDLFTEEDYVEFVKEFPDVDTVMLGRGLIANPALVDGIKNKKKLDKGLLKEFHDKVYKDYQSVLFGDRNVLFKMKEIWVYMITMFTNYEKYAKKIKKAERLSDYDGIISSLFQNESIR